MKTMSKQICLVFLAICLSASFLSADSIKPVWSVSSFGEGGYFYQPSDLEVDPGQSLIYVADAGNNNILAFDFQGKFLKVIGNKGQGPGEFLKPTGMCILKDSGLAVADFENNRIQIFDKSGKFLRAIAVTEARVADLISADGRFYTVPSFGYSGFRLNMGSQEKTQPLVTVLDDQGKKVQEISGAEFPETQPFMRAIKYRVCLALSPEGRLYLPHFAMNIIQAFEQTGKKIGEFSRPLPFKPILPRLEEQKSLEEGIISMRASLDFVSAAARFGPDGNLYILTHTESFSERVKKEKNVGSSNLPPDPMRIDVIDPNTYKIVRTIACDPGTKVFGILDKSRLVYIQEDSEGELILKCIEY